MNLINKMIISCIPFLPESVVRIFSKKYVAGINNTQVLQVIKKINTDNQYATVDILGEHTSSIQNCKNIANQYIELLQEIDNKKLNCNLSIKPSHIGADISYEVVFENFKEILKTADSYNNFIRIDMESSKLTKTTIRLYKDLKLISNNIGIVFQAYLHRTQDDILNLPENSEVIVPAMTWCSTAFSVINANLKPILVDIEKNGTGICPESLKKTINRKTKAVIVVHMLGVPAQLD